MTESMLRAADRRIAEATVKDIEKLIAAVQNESRDYQLNALSYFIPKLAQGSQPYTLLKQEILKLKHA